MFRNSMCSHAHGTAPHANMLLRVLVHARTVLVVVRTAALRHRGRRVRAVVAVLELGVGACLVDQLRPHGNIPLRRTPINLQIVKAVPYNYAIGVDVSPHVSIPIHSMHTSACSHDHAQYAHTSTRNSVSRKGTRLLSRCVVGRRSSGIA